MNLRAVNLGLGLAGLVALVACGHPPANPAPMASPTAQVETTNAAEQCSLRGKPRMWAGASLFAQANAGPPIVEFTGDAVDIQVTAFPEAKTERVAVTVRSGGLALEGFVEPYELELFARHELAIFGEAVVLPAGAAIRVLGAKDQSLLIEPEFSDFSEVRARVRCSDLSFERALSVETPPQGSPFHLLEREVALHASPDTALITKLKASREGPTVYALEQRGQFIRIGYAQGVRIDGWLPLAALSAGFGPDCDDGYSRGPRDSSDRCPTDNTAEASAETGCPESGPPPPIARPRVGTPVHLGPSEDAPLIGTTEPGAEVFVLERKGGWSRIQGRGASVRTPAVGGLWLKTDP